MIKAVLYDMDGVLVDARDWHYTALNRALALFGAEIGRHEHLRTFDGLPTRKKLQLLSLEGRLPGSLHAFIERLKQRFTRDEFLIKCNPIFRHQYALSRLRREGYLQALCSNSVRQTVEIMVDRAALAPYLDLILSNEDVLEPKPRPDIYIKATGKLRVAPEESLVLEDNERGIAAATAAGCHVLKIEDVDEVHYAGIAAKIRELDGYAAVSRAACG